jgi:hypothetical protein
VGGWGKEGGVENRLSSVGEKVSCRLWLRLFSRDEAAGGHENRRGAEEIRQLEWWGRDEG